MKKGQEVLESGWLVHRPMRAPHPDHIGENVFAERWRDLTAPVGTLSAILGSYRHDIDQREATVAASFVCMLGCNLGNALVAQAKRLARTEGALAFLAAWAMSNVRRSGVNGDVRAIEFVLAPEDHFEHTVMRGYVLTREPEPSVRDIEVVEHLAVWLGLHRWL